MPGRLAWAQEPVGYGCFPEPLTVDEANELQHPGPIWAILCPEPEEPVCTTPSAPILDPPVAGRPVPPNELKIIAAIPPEGTEPFTSLRIRGSYRLDAMSPYVDLWQIDGDRYVTSRDAVLSQFRLGNQAVYGASGLMEGAEHRFRVLFCRGEPGPLVGCTCWSDWSTWTAPTTFRPHPLSLPIGTGQLVEDEFDRRQTRPKRNRDGNVDPTDGKGDGAGASSVWMDEWATSMAGFPTLNGTQLAEDEGQPFLWVPINGFVVYVGEKAQDPHTWADVEFRPIETVLRANPEQRNYNVDLHARLTTSIEPTDVKLFSYLVKLAHEPDGIENVDEPTLRILRNFGASAGSTGGDVVPPRTLAEIAADSTADDCVTERIGDLQQSEVPVLLRVRVQNVEQEANVTATVAWNCVYGRLRLDGGR